MWHKYPNEKPSKNGHYLVTVVCEDTPFIVILYFDTEDKIWWVKDAYFDKLLAWAELPEPYKKD